MAKGMKVRTVRYCQRARKVSFATELDAKMALASRINQDKGEIRYYECQYAPSEYRYCINIITLSITSISVDI